MQSTAFMIDLVIDWCCLRWRHPTPVSHRSDDNSLSRPLLLIDKCIRAVHKHIWTLDECMEQWPETRQQFGFALQSDMYINICIRAKHTHTDLLNPLRVFLAGGRHTYAHPHPQANTVCIYRRIWSCPDSRREGNRGEWELIEFAQRPPMGLKIILQDTRTHTYTLSLPLSLCLARPPSHHRHLKFRPQAHIHFNQGWCLRKWAYAWRGEAALFIQRISYKMSLVTISPFLFVVFLLILRTRTTSCSTLPSWS